MKPTSNLSVFLFSIFLAVFTVSSAQAGQWVISLQCAGQGTGTIGNSAGGYTTTVLPWPTLVNGPSVHIYGPKPTSTATEAGTVTPVLTWTPSSSSDTSLPPSSVTVRLSTGAGSNRSAGQGVPISADDGLGDPSLNFYSGFGPIYLVGVAATGTQVRTKETQGQSVITFDPISLNTVSGAANRQIVQTQVSLNVNVVTPVQATSTASTVDPTSPVWFSGTACTATGTADLALLYGTAIPAGDYITSVTLKIGGSTVKSYPEDYIGIQPPSGLTAIPNLAVMWDSTHFSDGSPVVIEVEVYDTLGKKYKAHLTAPAYNKLLALGNQSQFGDNAVNSVNAVAAAANGINYNTTPSFQDSVATILGELPQYTAIYIDSHGGIGNLTDCLGDGVDPSHVFGIVEVSNAIRQKSPTYPPYNFAMFDACIVMGDKYNNANTADDAGMSSGFDLAQGTDRAALGFDWYTYSWASNSDWTKRLWTYLAHGVPLRQAASLSNLDGQIKGKPSPVFGVPFGFYSDLNPVIQGDSNMKLHGVYGGLVTSDGVGGLDIPWYKSL